MFPCFFLSFFKSPNPNCISSPPKLQLHLISHRSPPPESPNHPTPISLAWSAPSPSIAAGGNAYAFQSLCPSALSRLLRASHRRQRLRPTPSNASSGLIRPHYLRASHSSRLRHRSTCSAPSPDASATHSSMLPHLPRVPAASPSASGQFHAPTPLLQPDPHLNAARRVPLPTATTSASPATPISAENHHPRGLEWVPPKPTSIDRVSLGSVGQHPSFSPHRRHDAGSRSPPGHLHLL